MRNPFLFMGLGLLIAIISAKPGGYIGGVGGGIGAILCIIGLIMYFSPKSKWKKVKKREMFIATLERLSKLGSGTKLWFNYAVNENKQRG
jgi:hypothetical protein